MRLEMWVVLHPHISFWEEGICDRVTWCLGPFSLVITYISLSCLFPSTTDQNISLSPPLFVCSLPELGRSPSVKVESQVQSSECRKMPFLASLLTFSGLSEL